MLLSSTPHFLRLLRDALAGGFDAVKFPEPQPVRRGVNLNVEADGSFLSRTDYAIRIDMAAPAGKKAGTGSGGPGRKTAPGKTLGSMRKTLGQHTHPAYGARPGLAAWVGFFNRSHASHFQPVIWKEWPSK